MPCVCVSVVYVETSHFPGRVAFGRSVRFPEKFGISFFLVLTYTKLRAANSLVRDQVLAIAGFDNSN